MLTADVAYELLKAVLERGSDDSFVQQDFHILEDPWDVLRALYSIGLVGVREPIAGTFIYCHDGRAPNRRLEKPDKILIHPCYWIALNCPNSGLEERSAEEIYDECDIELSSEAKEFRDSKIQTLVSRLTQIPVGISGCTAFEDWCFNAIRICFAKGLRNIEWKPNRAGTTRRDIVATNLGDHGVWKRIYEDYGTRQVTFEVKNTLDLTAADYQQVRSYLTGDYGRVAFVVTRSETVDLYSGRDVEWVRDLHAAHNVLVIKLTGRFLSSQLGKLRNPQKHDAVDDSIHRLLDTYTRLYMQGQAKERRRRRKKRRKKSASH